MTLPRRTLHRIGLCFLIAIAGAGIWLAASARTAERMHETAAIRKAAEALKPLHSVKRKPGPSDWLANHNEQGQTFAQYLKSRSTPIRDEYATMYLQPLGEFTASQKKLMDLTADYLQRFYGVPVKTLKANALANLPESAERTSPLTGERQLLTSHLLNDVLIPARPKDAIAVLGLTGEDLWPGRGWNFVFGQASLNERVGVWSIHRFGDPDAGDDEFRTVLQRTIGTAAHETGHMLGIPHCIAYECGMNGSNNLSEADRNPQWFCPECEPKVWWTMRVDPAGRYRRLVEFAKSQHLDDEAAFWQKSLDALP